jgi:5-methylcytosine-specific restriction endonuclease McrBC GTP-binding regulatory subunit McrB
VVSKDRLTKLASEISDLQAVSNIDATFREVIGGSNSTAYWAALNAIRKLKPTSPGSIRDFSTFSYEGKKSAIEQFELKEYDAENADKFVLIIDEINRGNVAQIFGELITLIEDDKRMGQKNALKATLTYSNTAFSVPPNLYIIGTMNTADRSVEALDTALRRRFSFVKMEPKPDELPIKMIGNIDLVLMLKTINKRLEVLIDTDHTIGHAWLWDVDSLGGLKKAFKDKIIPLLQEFFYNDYEKIGLILGKDFVKQKPAKEYVHFAPFKGDSDLASSYHEKTIFTLAEMDEEITEASFLGIYTQKTDESK